MPGGEHRADQFVVVAHQIGAHVAVGIGKLKRNTGRFEGVGDGDLHATCRAQQLVHLGSHLLDLTAAGFEGLMDLQQEPVRVRVVQHRRDPDAFHQHAEADQPDDAGMLSGLPAAVDQTLRLPGLDHQAGVAAQGAGTIRGGLVVHGRVRVVGKFAGRLFVRVVCRRRLGHKRVPPLSADFDVPRGTCTGVMAVPSPRWLESFARILRWAGRRTDGTAISRVVVQSDGTAITPRSVCPMGWGLHFKRWADGTTINRIVV